MLKDIKDNSVAVGAGFERGKRMMKTRGTITRSCLSTTHQPTDCNTANANSILVT